MLKPIIQFLLILLFFSNLYSQNTELEITIINQHKDELNYIRSQLAKAASGERDQETIDNITKPNRPVLALIILVGSSFNSLE